MTHSHRTRLETCLSGVRPDRTPVALWRHFPVDDQIPAGLAAATIDFQRTFDFDLVKVTPASSFCLVTIPAGLSSNLKIGPACRFFPPL
jgi:uroporphyrinogen decarboxylase